MLAHLEDITSKTDTKKLHTAPKGLETQISLGLGMTWVSCRVSWPCITQRSPRLITFSSLCLHLHLSAHVYLYACNGSGLHSSRSSNSLLQCIALQPPMFQCPTSMLTRASLVLACIALEVLIVSCPTLPCNLPCFNTLHLHLTKLKEGVLRSIILTQVQQQQREPEAISFKGRFSPTLLTKMALVAQGTKEKEEYFDCLA